MRTSDVRTESDVRQWEGRLNREWPQRAQVADWIVAQIANQKRRSPRVIELACGAGYLAEFLVRQSTDVRYCGFDLSAHLLDFARRRLAPDRNAEIYFRQADLVGSDWTDLLLRMGWTGQVDAVISLQALHDLGGPEQQTAVLAQAREQLRPGGVLAYGDLLLDGDNPHPRRFTAAQHQQMLRAAGFFKSHMLQPANSARPLPEYSAAILRYGEFGCFGCYR